MNKIATYVINRADTWKSDDLSSNNKIFFKNPNKFDSNFKLFINFEKKTETKLPNYFKDKTIFLKQEHFTDSITKEERNISLETVDEINDLAKYMVEQRTLQINAFSDRISKLLSTSENYEIEVGVRNELVKLTEELGFDGLGTVVQELIFSYFKTPRIIEIICLYLEELNFEDVMPWGPYILSAMVSSKNEKIKEIALSLIDNWRDKSLLEFLKDIDKSSVWMEEYIDSILLSIKGI